MNGPIKVDRVALAAAAEMLKAHIGLLSDAYLDLIGSRGDDNAIHVRGAMRGVIAAIEHVVDDDFRGPETRGGS